MDSLLSEAARRRAARLTIPPVTDGASWEAEIDRQMVALRNQGRIRVVYRLGPPFRQVGRAVKGVLPVRLMGLGPPDWFAITPQELILGEDKWTAGTNFPLGANLVDHQGVALDAWAAAGGRAVLLVCTAAGRWCLDWPRVPRVNRLTPEQMDGCGYRFGDSWL